MHRFSASPVIGEYTFSLNPVRHRPEPCIKTASRIFHKNRYDLLQDRQV